MFICRIPTRSAATGERYFTHRLARSKRIGGKVRQVCLLNLGRHFSVEPKYWRTLCVRIEEIAYGQMSRVKNELPPAVALTAQRLAAQLLARQAEVPTLDGMLAGLGAPAGALVVMDAGIASQANI